MINFTINQVNKVAVHGTIVSFSANSEGINPGTLGSAIRLESILRVSPTFKRTIAQYAKDVTSVETIHVIFSRGTLAFVDVEW